MGVVDTEVFRQKAAVAAHGEDTGSWVPVLEQLASFRQFKHERGPDNAITKRSAAGDAYEIAEQAAKRVDTLTELLGGTRSDEARQAIQERIEMLAEDAVRAALTATRQTDFNSAYELRDELVGSTFAGARPRPTGEGLTDKAALGGPRGPRLRRIHPRGHPPPGLRPGRLRRAEQQPASTRWRSGSAPSGSGASSTSWSPPASSGRARSTSGSSR
ncbi:MAG: hypothetical protein HS111_28925 [Kofleriaceae bacterium]|nr:hypothetical protein [Kofleriaceae bacterium]